MTHNLVAVAVVMTLAMFVTSCAPARVESGTGASSDSSYKRHNDWARFGRPDVGGARANDR
ncbi:MAG: hypothetical protein HYU58_03630 [Proteobacteria bacterium]|nr:hypothetical protein [Pseudomonadota bacterium]